MLVFLSLRCICNFGCISCVLSLVVLGPRMNKSSLVTRCSSVSQGLIAYKYITIGKTKTK